MTAHATALFADRHAAHMAVEQLVQAGFPRDAISVVMTEDTHEREFGAPPSSDRSGVRPRHGVLATLVAGLAVLARTEGLVLRAAGPLMAGILRVGEPWGLSAVLIAAGLGEMEARSFDEGVRGGSIALGVHAPGDRLGLARQLLELSGGASPRAA
jgi:hypothetical protein